MNEQGVEPYITVEALLERARREREELAALWGGLSAERMTARPGPQADWSVKDMIAHISWWEAAMCDLVARAIAGERIAFDGTVDDANMTAFEESRDASLEAVLEAFAAGMARVEALMKSLSDEQINDVAVCQIFGKPLRHFIAANTYGHYADHVDDLRAYVGRD